MSKNKLALHEASERVALTGQRFREAKLELNEILPETEQRWRDAADAYAQSLEEYAAALHLLHFELLRECG